MPDSRSVVFLALDVFRTPGGLQRFNRRVISALGETAAALRCTSLVLRDRTNDVPGDLRRSVRAFGGDRVRFAKDAVRAARHADTILVSQINLLPIAWASKLMRPSLRIVLFVHGVEVWNDARYRRRKPYEPFLLRWVDQIASVSRYTASVMQREFGIDERRIVIFPNAVDGPLTGSNELHASQTLLSVTRLAPHDRGKNLDRVLAAFARLPPTLGAAMLQVVGDGELRPELEALAGSLGIADRVRFLGRVTDDDLEACYAAARAFVLPSSKEGFGIVYLEAWKHGLPVICGSEGASSEIVSDGVDGYVVDPNDVDAIADRMARLLSDETLGIGMGRRGMEKVQGRYLDSHFRANLDSLLGDMAPEKSHAA